MHFTSSCDMSTNRFLFCFLFCCKRVRGTLQRFEHVLFLWVENKLWLVGERVKAVDERRSYKDGRLVDSNTFSSSSCPSPAGSPSRSGDDAVYVFDINQPSLPTPFYSILVSVSVFMSLSSLFHSIHSADNSPLSHSFSPSAFSAILVLSTMFLCMKVSLSPDIILCG